MKIFVISLKDSKDRRKEIESQMKSLGLEFEFFDAIDGRQGVPKQYIDRIDYKSIRRNTMRDMATGEIGVSLSHSLLYKKIIDENIIDEAVILEDDAILTRGFAELVKSDKLQQSKFDMILLCHWLCYMHESFLIPLIGKYKIGKTLNNPSFSVAYYVNKKALQKLRNATQKISYTSDFPIDLRNGDVGAIVPRIVRHPHISNSLVDADRAKMVYKYKEALFGRFGFITWVRHKIMRPKNGKGTNFSKEIHGE